MMGKVLRVVNTAVIAAAAGTAAAVMIRDVIREQRAGAEARTPGAREGHAAKEAGAALEVRALRVENYGPHAGTAQAEIAPVTILVGPNGAGKTRLADALETLACGLGASLPRGGGTLAHVLAGRAHRARGAAQGVSVGATWDAQGETLAVDVRVREDAQGLARIEQWTMHAGAHTLAYTAHGADTWAVEVDGEAAGTRTGPWRDAAPAGDAPAWARAAAEAVGQWSEGMRRIGRPRSETTRVGRDASAMGVLASTPEVGEAVIAWAEKAFGETLVIGGTGAGRRVRVGEGRGMHALDARTESAAMLEALPVAVAAASAQGAGAGIDIIEHPEAGLDERAETASAELLLAGRAQGRTLLIETHGALTVLALRRAIAREEIAAGDARVVYVERDGTARTVRSGGFDAEGEPEGWPEGLFTQEYEAVCALRREQRAGEGGGRESRAQSGAAGAEPVEEG